MDGPLTFDAFWGWLAAHPNCILRAGTRDAVVYDDEDLHWHFASESPETVLVQVVRGKRLMGEIFLEPERVAYVQSVDSEQPDEFTFELVGHDGDEREVIYFFVLTHGLDAEESAKRPRVH